MKPRSSYVPFHRIGYLYRVSLMSLLTQRTLCRVSVIIYHQRPRLLLFQYKLVGHPLVLTGSIVRIITNESCHILLCEVGNIQSLCTVLLSSIALSYNYIKRLALISKFNGFLIVHTGYRAFTVNPKISEASVYLVYFLIDKSIIIYFTI